MSIYILNDNHSETAESLLLKKSLALEKRRQRKHEFWILTCYLDLKILENVIDSILESVRLTDVYLAFNFAEIYKEGPDATIKHLNLIASNLKEKRVNLEWTALAGKKLVHSKAYALVQMAESRIYKGFLLTTSANFTKAGFQGEHVEIGYLSVKKTDINKFIKLYKILLNDFGKNPAEAVSKERDYMFKFLLLSSGVFLHKWTGNLSQWVGIRYELTDFAKEKGIVAAELKAVGFEAGDTFTRQVLDLSSLPKKDIPGEFIKNFTIETYWGRWCPLDAWSSLTESFQGGDYFVNKFLEITNKDILHEIKIDSLQLQNELIEKKLIRRVKDDHLDNWVMRIQKLRLNRLKLNRFFMGYDVNFLPYLIEQKREVEDLYNNFEDSILSSKTMNIAKKKISAAIKYNDLGLIRLKDAEKKIVKNIACG